MRKIYTTLFILFLFVSLAMAAPPSPMKLTFNTLAPGSSDNTITLPFRGTVNVTVDWGDGTATENFTTSGNRSHVYSNAGTYIVTINGAMTAYGFGSGTPLNAEKLVAVNTFGGLGASSFSGAFSGTTNLASLPTILPYTLVDLSYLFFNSKYNGDISAWDVSRITNMSNMFAGNTVFDQNIGLWNVGNVTNMNGMFNGAVAFNQNISGWNVSKVTDMSFMFANTSLFNKNIGTWDVSNVINMSFMFANNPVFNQDIGSWNVANTTNMSGMLNGVNLSVLNYDALLSGWSSQTLKPAVIFSAGKSKYSSCAAAARAILTDTYGWTISDAGSNSGFSVVNNQAVSNVGVHEVTANGNVICLGISNPTSYGFCWNTTGSPTVSNSKINKGTIATTGDFSSQITGLLSNTTYYLRTFATNSAGTAYGEQVSFKTSESTSSDKELTLKVYLEGLWNGTNMNKCKDWDDDLQDVVDLFGSDIVDTISVELHNAIYSEIAYQFHGLELHQDGTVTSMGKSFIEIPETVADDYYITIRTRNHLETTTAQLVSFNTTSISYDFTDDSSKAFESDMNFTPMKEANGVWVLYSGNPLPIDPPQLNTDAIDITDTYAVINNLSDLTGIYGYDVRDLNGDGVIDYTDVYDYALPNYTDGIYFFFPE